MAFVISGGAVVNSICMRLPSGTVERSETTLHFKEHPVYKQFYFPNNRFKNEKKKLNVKI